MHPRGTFSRRSLGWRRFASYGRLICFDLRGVGLSDPVEDLPPLEEWMDDVRAVMDAVGSLPQIPIECRRWSR
jgi:pimeloyl-ACP methyl ester carboxylesterase